MGILYQYGDKEYPSTFIWRGNNDRSVKPINSDLLVSELEKNNVNYDYYRYSKAAHGVGLGDKTEAQDWPLNAIKFWTK